MAKISVSVRNQKRQKLISKFAERRSQLKKQKDFQGLDKLPKNALPVRLRKRCFKCQRPRGIIMSDDGDEKTAICRICFRQMASQGLIPGVRKASW